MIDEDTLLEKASEFVEDAKSTSPSPGSGLDPAHSPTETP